MRHKTVASLLATPIAAAMTLLIWGAPAHAETLHTAGGQVTSFTDPCHADTTGTLDLTYQQVQLTPHNQSRQVETGQFTFTPDNPGQLSATGHFVDQQTFITDPTPGTATLTETIHAVAHYTDGTQNPVQLTTQTTFINFAPVDTQVRKTVCGN